MQTIWQDIKYSVRVLLKSPGFTFVAVLALALGIGANTAIFSVVNTVVLHPLPFAQPETLLRLGQRARGQEMPERGAFSFADYKDVQAQSQTLSAVAAFLNSGTMVTTDNTESERIYGADVSPEYFTVLGVQPERGRAFTAAEDHENAAVVVISHGLWQRRFGGTENIIGQKLRMGSSSVTIVGVMPPAFEYPMRAINQHQDFWEPLNDRPSPDRTQRDNRSYNVIGRMKPGVTLSQARAELDAIARRLEQQYPNEDTRIAIGAAPLPEDVTRDIRPALWILMGAVGFVLLIACANVANLMLARATSRQKEIAIRAALGASHWRVMRQLLVESLLLGLTGGGLGLILANWGIAVLVAASPANIPRVEQIRLDGRVLVFTLLVSSLTGIVFGLLPALRAAKVELTDSLKEGGRGNTEGLRHNRVRSLLVISEVTLSLILLIGAGLLLKSFVRVLETNPGFDAHNVIAFDVPLSRQRYDTPEKQTLFFNQLVERTRSLPGVVTVGLVDNVPLGTSIDTYNFQIVGQPPFPPGAQPEAHSTLVSPGYFIALKIPLRDGRLFSDTDTKDSPPAVIISKALAEQFFPGTSAVGQRLIIDPAAPPREIVGVVGDARRRGLERAPELEMYIPFTQLPQRRMNLIVRTANDPASLVTSFRATLKDLDKDQTIWQTRTLDQLVAASMASRRFNMTLLGLFALVALILAAVGIYGVMAYSVTRRTHEIGVRMALGAKATQVLQLILKDALVLAAIGVASGLAAAFWLTQLMRSLLFEVKPTDVVTFAGVSTLLILITLLASLIPARRATKVDPLVALRYE
ncbi:MAG TPA: ABC transporter permease [Pyrinomonadaceae bacterium]|nr:ABC transporter permease [Pyrinomonadaceae bacterium]